MNRLFERPVAMRKWVKTIGILFVLLIAVSATVYGIRTSAASASVFTEYSESFSTLKSNTSKACETRGELEAARGEAAELGLEIAGALESQIAVLDDSIRGAVELGAPGCRTFFEGFLKTGISEQLVEESKVASFALERNIVSASQKISVANKEIKRERYRLAVAEYDSARDSLLSALSEGRESLSLDVSEQSIVELEEAISVGEELLELEKPGTIDAVESLTRELRESERLVLEFSEKVVSEWDAIIGAEEILRAEALSLASQDWGATEVESNGWSDSSVQSYASNYTLYVSDCGGDAQACVDGSSVTFIDFGSLQWVGGHNYGAAGIISSFEVGDIVTVVGSSAAGTYRITGHSWVTKDGSAAVADVPPGFAFQTCTSTQMVLAYAERI